MRKNPATAVDTDEYESYERFPDVNTYDDDPHDKSEWDD